MNPGTGGSASDPPPPVPPLPDLDGELGSLDFPLRPLDRQAPVVVGGDARVAATPAGLSLETEAGPVAEALGPIGASEERTIITPLGLERTLRFDRGTARERAVVPFTGAVGFIEWTAPTGVPALAWRVPAGPVRSRWRATDRALLVERAGERLLFVLSEPAAFEVREGADGLGVRAASSAARRRMVAIGTTAGSEARRVTRIMGRAAIVVRGRESRIRRLLEDRLTVEAPDDRPGRELAWSKISLAAWEAGPHAGVIGPVDAAVAEASLTTGGGEAVRRGMMDGWAAGASGPAVLQIATRYLAWTGDRPTVAGLWDRIVASSERAVEEGTGGAMRAGIARLAKEVGAPVPAWRDAPVATASPRTGDPGTAVGPAAPLPVRSAAVRVLRLASTLGVVPDAPRGRLELRPRLDRWTRFRLEGLRVGDAVVALSYVREATVARFTVTQTRGAPPLQLVLAPLVAATSVAEARVDGAPARLAPQPVGSLWKVPVQLVLDRDRTVEVELGTSDH